MNATDVPYSKIRLPHNLNEATRVLATLIKRTIECFLIAPSAVLSAAVATLMILNGINTGDLISGVYEYARAELHDTTPGNIRRVNCPTPVGNAPDQALICDYSQTIVVPLREVADETAKIINSVYLLLSIVYAVLLFAFYGPRRFFGLPQVEPTRA
jgi:hypothetical protein